MNRVFKVADDLGTLMENARISPAPKNVNWTPMPDPIRKEEVNIQLAWTAGARTKLPVRRQANLMGFETPAGYLTQMIAMTLASNDENTVITKDGRLVHKTHAHDSDGPCRLKGNPLA
jgi:hypothetical protein